jgi:DNA-binding transcriptional LysR family regulator
LRHTIAVVQNDFRWDDARIFLALLRAGTLSGAGAALGVNASTVGRRLDVLEDSLGARLFDRTPDGVRPTAAAELVQPAAERLESAAHELGAAARGIESAPEGVVRLSVAPGVSSEFVAPALPRLLERHPKLKIELDASIGYADLTRREADLAIRGLRPESGDLIARRLGTSGYALMCTPDHAAAQGPLRDPAAARWITWQHDLDHIPSGRWITAVVPEEAIVLRTSNIATQIAAVRAGLGIALLPRIYLAGGELVEVRVGPALRRRLPPPPVDEAWLVGHRALREVPRVAAVWQFIVDEFAALPPSVLR